MSGTRSRNKGKRGENAAAKMLTSRGYHVEKLTSGVSCGDLVAEYDGEEWLVEVKFRSDIPVVSARHQAQVQRGHRRWMVCAHIDGTDSWLVGRQSKHHGGKWEVWE